MRNKNEYLVTTKEKYGFVFINRRLEKRNSQRPSKMPKTRSAKRSESKASGPASDPASDPASGPASDPALGTKATVSVGTQVDLFELLMLSNAPPPETITKDGFSYKLNEAKQDPKDRYWGTHYVCATAGCTRWAYVSRRNGVVMTRGPAKNPKEPHNHGPNDE